MLILNIRLKNLRETLNLNQTEFGEKIGVKQATIAGYETGRRLPLEPIISSICREFKVNEIWLRTGEGEMFTEETKDEQLSYFFGQILASDDSSIIKTIMLGFAKLSPEQRDILEDLLKTMFPHLIKKNE